jgi:hypothetical protein
MKKSTILILLMGALLSLLLPVHPSYGGPSGRAEGLTGILPAPETRYILISGRNDEGRFITGIEPFNDFRLGRFTKVIWTNNAEVSVRIRLGSGKKCEEVSEATLRVLGTRFLGSCYVTKNPIPAGGILETRFEEFGRYAYEVEYEGKEAKESGVIEIY